MEIMCMQALSAIQNARTDLPQLTGTEEYKLLNKPTHIKHYNRYYPEVRRRLYALTPEQVKSIVDRIGIPEIHLIDGVGPKRIQALLEYAEIEEFIPSTYWLIYYTYFDSQIDQRKDINVKIDVKIDINIAIKQSPASWLVEYNKEFPDHLVTLKMAIPITEKDYKLF